MQPPAPDPSKLMRQTVRQALLIVGLFIAGAVLFQPQLQAAGRWFYDRLGLWGAFLGTLLSDALAIPITFDVYLAAAVAAGRPAVPVLAAVCCGSLIGALFAWALGRKLRGRTWLLQRLERFQMRVLFERWGSTAVVIGAWTPIPFSVTCWFAGIYGLSLRRFSLAILHRIPRALITFALLQLGWVAVAG